MQIFNKYTFYDASSFPGRKRKTKRKLGRGLKNPFGDPDLHLPCHKPSTIVDTFKDQIIFAGDLSPVREIQQKHRSKYRLRNVIYRDIDNFFGQSQYDNEKIIRGKSFGKRFRVYSEDYFIETYLNPEKIFKNYLYNSLKSNVKRFKSLKIYQQIRLGSSYNQMFEIGGYVSLSSGHRRPIQYEFDTQRIQVYPRHFGESPDIITVKEKHLAKIPLIY